MQVLLKKKITKAAIFPYIIFNLQISLVLCKTRQIPLFFAPCIIIEKIVGQSSNLRIRIMITCYL